MLQAREVFLLLIDQGELSMHDRSLKNWIPEAFR